MNRRLTEIDHPPRLAPLLIVALALRAAVPIAGFFAGDGQGAWLEPDSGAYINLARSLADDGRFARHGEPEILRTPGYPAVLVPGVWFGQVERFGVALQIVLGTATVAVVYRLGLALGVAPRAAWLAAAVMAVEPLTVLYAGKLLTETLFVFLFAVALWLLARAMKFASIADLSGAALALSAATLVRPVTYWLPLPVAALVAWRCAIVLPGRWVAGAVRCALFLAVAFSVPLAWQGRNAIVADYVGYSSIFDMDLYFCHAASVLADQRGVTLDQVQRELGFNDRRQYLELHPHQADWAQAERARYQRREGWRIIAADPLRYAGIHVRGMLATLLDNGTSAYLDYFGRSRGANAAPAEVERRGPVERFTAAVRARPAMVAVWCLLEMLVLALLMTTGCGLVAGCMPRGWAYWLALGVTAYLLLLSGGPLGSHRFRLPMMPLLSIAAGCGLATIVDRARVWRATRRETRTASDARPGT